MSIDLTKWIATVPGFPKEGILFRDVTPMLQDPESYREATRQICEYCKSVGAEMIVGPESRGFIFGCPAAVELGVGFAPIRKPGKLPRETVSCKYDLEYGSNELFMHKDAIKQGQRVVIVDDLLATGGTAKATCKMIEEMGGVVAGICFVVELSGLPGREVLEGYDVHSLMVLSDC